MCTVSWLRRAGAFELFFNRDERRSRGPAVPPAVRSKEAVRFIAPLDGDFGGSWLGVNQRGLTLALLNGYAAADEGREEPAGGYTSRGLLLTALIDSPSAAQAERRLRRHDLTRFRSFLLAAFEPGGEEWLADWSAGRLDVRAGLDPLNPIVSSSFDTEEVRRSRIEQFTKMAARSTTASHLEFHCSHEPEKGPYSPCMHRPDAKTVSFSWIQVSEDAIHFRYVPHSPCKGLPGRHAVTLARRRARSAAGRARD